MLKIDNYDEAAYILGEPIVHPEEVKLAYLQDHQWVLVGGMQKTKGEYSYGFRNKSTWTMWCEDLEVRRWPTGPELDQIRDEIQNNSVDKPSK